MKRLAIIGGGASGLMAAVAAGLAARESAEGLSITLYEEDEKVGRSILRSGNGRCNFSNATIDAAIYRNTKFVEKVFEALETQAADLPGFSRDDCPRDSFGEEGDAASSRAVPANAAPANVAFPNAASPNAAPANAVLRLFENLGLTWRKDAEGRLYPRTNKASTVLDVLRAPLDELGVAVRTNTRIARIECPHTPSSPYTLVLGDGAFERAEAVIVALGSSARAGMFPPDLSFAPIEALLGPIATDAKPVKALDNIRARAKVSLLRRGELVCTEEGEVQFRAYGVSGIVIFNLSRLARQNDTLEIDFLPFCPEEEIAFFAKQRLTGLRAIYPQGLDVAAFLRGLVLPLVAQSILKTADMAGNEAANEETAQRILHAAKHFSLTVKGMGAKQQCQIHRGGLDPQGFSADMLESIRHRGLFGAGEALDVDAPCGGYNLHWAWTSGALAGINAVHRLLEGDPSVKDRLLEGDPSVKAVR